MKAERSEGRGVSSGRAESKSLQKDHPELMGRAQLVWTLLVAMVVALVTLHNLKASGPNREPWSDHSSIKSVQVYQPLTH